MQVKFLPRTVVILGLVSFFNDAASEMITPLLPVFLTAALGAGPVVVGLVEGVAEATASVLKLVAGRLDDRGWNSKGLVLSGYGISNTARPLIGLAFGWSWVLLLRFLDRVGKGLRTSPRDAIIAASTDSHLRGRVFGFQRALDHAGAVVGPLLAFALLGGGVEMRQLFLLSVVPGIMVMLLLWYGLPATPAKLATDQSSLSLGWGGLDPRLRALIMAAGGLALATTPEVFLVLWAQSRGLEIVWVPLLWAAASAVKVLVAVPGGYWSDRFGRLPVLVAGWGMRILILISLGLAGSSELTIWVLFLAYAASLAFTEGAERALIGDFAPVGKKATAFGLYHMTSGLLALPGAVLFGALWQWFGEAPAFYTAASLTALSVTLLLGIVTATTRS
ncbi:MAG: MFS transporter [Gammaproteobacteria bacterium]|jgi:MFS family permease|nr:MFS transporter [Gammaproteobacteria bacterium]